MSKKETQLTRWYWKQRGGTLIEEFPAVGRSADHGQRLLDGLIVLGGKCRIAKASDVSIEGRDVVIIQSKNSRLGMYLMGQALFSIDLIRPFNPRSIESIALCAADDDVLRPFLERHAGCKVVVCPEKISRLMK